MQIDYEKVHIISVSGMIAGDLNDDNNVYHKIHKTMIKFFSQKNGLNTRI